MFGHHNAYRSKVFTVNVEKYAIIAILKTNSFCTPTYSECQSHEWIGRDLPSIEEQLQPISLLTSVQLWTGLYLEVHGQTNNLILILNFYFFIFRQMFRKLHTAYTNVVANPFFTPGECISSKKFDTTARSIMGF